MGLAGSFLSLYVGGDGAALHPGGGRGGHMPGEQAQVVVHPDFVRPELQHPAMAGGGGQVRDGRPQLRPVSDEKELQDCLTALSRRS